MAKLAIVACLLIASSGCSTITIHPQQTHRQLTPPTYQSTEHFLFWGLEGETRVDVQEICGERDVVQMQTQLTFTNGLLTVLTLGIYSPHSVKVWCA